MKKTVFTLLIVLVLFWSCRPVFAKGKGEGKGKTQQDKSTKQAQAKRGGSKTDADQTADKGKQIRQKEREQVQQQAKEQEKQQQKTTKTTPKGKEKSKAARDTEKAVGKTSSVEGKGKAEAKVLDKGKQHQQQLKAIDRQILHEQAKHQRRQARLKRISELAAEKGSDEIVQRINKLGEKEKQRFDQKTHRLQERKQEVLQLGEQASAPKAKKDTKKAAGEQDSETKEKDQPEEDKPEDKEPGK